jgi:hypothetical protein
MQAKRAHIMQMNTEIKLNETKQQQPHVLHEQVNDISKRFIPSHQKLKLPIALPPDPA